MAEHAQIQELSEYFSGLAQKRPIRMMPVLEAVERHLPTLLEDSNQWQSVMIDYQPPHLMRLYRQLGDVRVNLHYFLPAADVSEATKQTDAYNENLYHPHAWASAMRIVEGTYAQYWGMAGKGGFDAVPPKDLHLTHKAGDSYDMNHPWMWHQVIPAPNQAVLTLMVTYVPPKGEWDQETPRSTKILERLDQSQHDFVMQKFRQHYPKI